MAARGDVSREEKNLTAPYAATIAGALGMGNDDFSREAPPKSGGGGPGPTPEECEFVILNAAEVELTAVP